jgi:hypothetical protein
MFSEPRLGNKTQIFTTLVFLPDTVATSPANGGERKELSQTNSPQSQHPEVFQSNSFGSKSRMLKSNSSFSKVPDFMLDSGDHRKSWLKKSSAKHLVSGNRSRFIDDTYDLDLSYITSRVIAMAYPAEDFVGPFASMIRNNLKCVVVSVFLWLSMCDHGKKKSNCIAFLFSGLLFVGIGIGIQFTHS